MLGKLLGSGGGEADRTAPFGEAGLGAAAWQDNNRNTFRSGSGRSGTRPEPHSPVSGHTGSSPPINVVKFPNAFLWGVGDAQ